MKNFFTKLTITNSVNEDSHNEWGKFETPEEQEAWKNEKEAEQKQWNYNTPGAMSYRYYEYQDYDLLTILDADLSDLEGLTLREFMEIIKSVEL